METQPATGDGRRFELHAFVCTDGPNCKLDGPAEEVVRLLRAKAKDSPLAGRVRINKSGCLDQCGHGPMMVVYPEGVWYAHLTLEDAARVWDEHFLGGRPVADLVYRTGDVAGKNKIPGKVPGQPPDTSRADYRPCSRCPWGPATGPSVQT